MGTKKPGNKTKPTLQPGVFTKPVSISLTPGDFKRFDALMELYDVSGRSAMVRTLLDLAEGKRARKKG